MENQPLTESQIRTVGSFNDLVTTSFEGENNAICWKRNLVGDFEEIVRQLESEENVREVSQVELLNLQLSSQGELAREILLSDLKLLQDYGASPVLNIIKHYESDDFFFPTDVYSFHVDRSPVPTDTFLCTYHGAASEIIPNSQALQKIHVPEIRDELKSLYNGNDQGFESFLSEHFFDLHYQVKPESTVINLGQGHVWKLAVDHPDGKVLPCVHRAPKENEGEHRLLLIC